VSVALGKEDESYSALHQSRQDFVTVVPTYMCCKKSLIAFFGCIGTGLLEESRRLRDYMSLNSFNPRTSK
jgi:hypothetical protein